ncbi:bifunctional Aldolase-type TIM barrel/Ribulose-phosphate binding barrel [Babesia duncani]|uniref:Bifunctional Aldolase-type TIM barrel/Ribulose-phosphate binding barrel n=1 Tax=Babesia duncani TaxID=323732 RepID=A0AAD9UQM1_9APIC|nr:bifunctional Aldolase-type TIM barrel/Ribulose-phosphate binding barrel [Babesia duncani]
MPQERFYKMITDKQHQVDLLLRNHSDPQDKLQVLLFVIAKMLQLRLNFMQCTANHKLTEMLKRHSTESCHQLSTIADMKRRTPTHNPKCDNTILSYIDAAEVAMNIAKQGWLKCAATQLGFDVIFINTDEASYGGHIDELHRCFLELRKLGRRQRPAIVMKDIILHPIQVCRGKILQYRLRKPPNTELMESF